MRLSSGLAARPLDAMPVATCGPTVPCRNVLDQGLTASVMGEPSSLSFQLCGHTAPVAVDPLAVGEAGALVAVLPRALTRLSVPRPPRAPPHSPAPRFLVLLALAHRLPHPYSKRKIQRHLDSSSETTAAALPETAGVWALPGR